MPRRGGRGVGRGHGTKGLGRGTLSESSQVPLPPDESLPENPGSSTDNIPSTSSNTNGNGPTSQMTLRQRNPKASPPPAQITITNSNRGRGKGRGRGRGKGNNPVQSEIISLPSNSDEPSAPVPVKVVKKPRTNSKNATLILSSTVKLRLGSAPAAFGDVEDIFNDKVVNDEGGGTIRYNIDVRRKFMPGNYILHIVKTAKTSKYASQYGVILCREDVDPAKIHDLLKDSSYITWDFRLSNGISRYDWKHFRNWGSFQHEKIKMEKRMKRWKRKREEMDFYDQPVCRNPQQAFAALAELMANARNDNYYCRKMNGWSRSPSPEPEPETPKKTPEEIAHDVILARFQTILLDYFMNKDKIVKQCTLFVDSGRIQEIGDGKFTIIQDNDWVYIIRGNGGNGETTPGEGDDVAAQGGQGLVDPDDPQVLGFLIKERPNKAKTLIAGDWHYGCVLQDQGSQEYFGFVFGDCFENQENVKSSNDIAAKNYILDVNQLLLS